VPCRLASQPVNEGRKVGETRKGNGDDAGCEKEGEGRLLEGLGACACREDCLCPQQQQHIEEVKGTDEEIRLSVMDLIGDEEEKEEEVEGV